INSGRYHELLDEIVSDLSLYSEFCLQNPKHTPVSNNFLKYHALALSFQRSLPMFYEAAPKLKLRYLSVYFDLLFSSLSDICMLNRIKNRNGTEDLGRVIEQRLLKYQEQPLEYRKELNGIYQDVVTFVIPCLEIQGKDFVPYTIIFLKACISLT